MVCVFVCVCVCVCVFNAKSSQNPIKIFVELDSYMGEQRTKNS